MSLLLGSQDLVWRLTCKGLHVVDQRSEQFLAHMWCLQRVSAASLHRQGVASLLRAVHGGPLLVMLGQMESANARRTWLWGQWYWPFKLLAELSSGWFNHVPAVNLERQGRISYIDWTKSQLCAPTGSKPPGCHTLTIPQQQASSPATHTFSWILSTCSLEVKWCSAPQELPNWLPPCWL